MQKGNRPLALLSLGASLEEKFAQRFILIFLNMLALPFHPYAPQYAPRELSVIMHPLHTVFLSGPALYSMKLRYDGHIQTGQTPMLHSLDNRKIFDELVYRTNCVGDCIWMDR